MTLLIILLIVFITLSAFSSASETALFSLSSIKVKTFKLEEDPRKQLVAKLLASPKDLLVTIIMLNVIVNILIQNVVSSIFDEFTNWGLKVGVPLAIVLIFGEVIPKSIGIANNMKIALTVAPFMSFVQKLLLPLRKVITAVTNGVSRFFFFFLRPEEEISVDELHHALAASRKFGVLNEDEAEIVRGFLELQEASVKQAMRPREDVIYFDMEDSIPQLVSLFVDSECTRVPVCEGGLDKVLGVVTSRIFFLHRHKIKKSQDLLAILQKPFFAPESMSAKSLLRQMYEKEVSIAIVVDEYGSVSGIIAMEDLVEMVVGEIYDRRDRKSSYTRSGEDVIIASGKLELAEFEEIFGIPLYSENQMITLGGWLTEQLGDIPKAGTKYLTEDFLFHVLSADPNRIRRIYVRLLKRKE